MSAHPSTPEILATVEPDLFDLAEDYLEKRKAELENISQLLKNNDFQMIETIGHKIQGNAELFGLEWLAKGGGQMEENAKARDHEKLLVLAERLLQKLHQVKFVSGPQTE